MRVIYSFRDDTFYFYPADVPAEHFVGYSQGTKMYDYLSTLVPLDFMRKAPGIDFIQSNVRYIFTLTDSQVLDMPFFTPID